MSKCPCYTLREVSAEVFVDENSEFDPDVADSSSYSSKQVHKTGRKDSVLLFPMLLYVLRTIKDY